MQYHGVECTACKTDFDTFREYEQHECDGENQ